MRKYQIGADKANAASAVHARRKANATPLRESAITASMASFSQINPLSPLPRLDLNPGNARTLRVHQAGTVAPLRNAGPTTRRGVGLRVLHGRFWERFGTLPYKPVCGQTARPVAAVKAGGLWIFAQSFG